MLSVVLHIRTMGLASSGRVLMIPIQAPFGDRACLRDFTARLTAFRPAVAYVTIDYQEALTPGPDGLAGYGCPPGPVRTIRIKLPAPLGRRQVILNHQQTFWSVSATRLAATARVHQEAPQFPADLCAALPAVAP